MPLFPVSYLSFFTWLSFLDTDVGYSWDISYSNGIFNRRFFFTKNDLHKVFIRPMVKFSKKASSEFSFVWGADIFL